MDVSQNGVYHGMPSIMATYNRNDDDKRFSDPHETPFISLAAGSQV
jgi:DhnA family fructose-bisphosphate aldolase class Ia